MSLKVSVIGTGYLGATHAACMAELGFEVIGLDIDQAKIERLAEGLLPFHEPELPELLRKHVLPDGCASRPPTLRSGNGPMCTSSASVRHNVPTARGQTCHTSMPPPPRWRGISPVMR